jgi:1-acyl-sn-glycerol-3-phosphate acyltransferase
VVFVSVGLLLSDVVQRLLVAPFVWLFPSTRVPVLGQWIKFMAWLTTRPVQFFGGCVIPRPPRIVPGGPGILIVMNHQSLFDIPLVVQTVTRGYPRIVTRKRYIDRWIPVISQMVRLYQYPIVDPSANADEILKSLDGMQEAARTTDVPLAVFPEGTRTRNGEIGRFKKRGLAQILAVRPWTVYVFVVDGFWRAARFRDFVRGLPHVEGKMEHVATMEWTDPTQDSTSFTDEMHAMMSERLSAMRGEPVTR